jgi:hypothetical protein
MLVVEVELQTVLEVWEELEEAEQVVTVTELLVILEVLIQVVAVEEEIGLTLLVGQEVLEL